MLVIISITLFIGCFQRISTLIRLCNEMVEMNETCILRYQLTQSKFPRGVSETNFEKISSIFVHDVNTNIRFIGDIREIMINIATLIVANVFVLCCVYCLSIKMRQPTAEGEANR
jgi:hypothetical protein